MASSAMDPETIKNDHQARTERVLAAHYREVNAPARELVLQGIIQGCYELALIWREEATAAMDANKKGCKTQAEGLREAAARISAFAVAAHKHGSQGSWLDTSPPAEPSSTLDTGKPETVAVSIPGKLEDIEIGPPSGDAAAAIAELLSTDPLIASKPYFRAMAELPEVKVSPDTLGETAVDPFAVHMAALEKFIKDDPFAVGRAKWKQDPQVPVFALDDDPATWLASPDHTSPSQADTAAGCGMKWWLAKRRGAPARPSWANVGGTALHHCIEDILLKRVAYAAQPEVSAEAVREHFMHHLIHTAMEAEDSPYPRDTWHASRGGKEDEAWWAQDGPEMLHRWLEWRGKWLAEGWELLYLQDGRPVVELEITTSRGVKMIIDSAWIHRARNTVAIVDWKSGSIKPADYFQVFTNALGLSELGMLQVTAHVFGAYWSARSGELGPLTDLLKRHTVAEVEMRLDAPRKMDAIGLYMPNVNGGYGGCGSCAYRLSCPVGSRAGLGEENLTSQ